MLRSLLLLGSEDLRILLGQGELAADRRRLQEVRIRQPAAHFEHNGPCQKQPAESSHRIKVQGPLAPQRALAVFLAGGSRPSRTSISS